MPKDMFDTKKRPLKGRHVRFCDHALLAAFIRIFHCGGEPQQ
ncbi:hypothetical protein TG4357_01441 [Thalassovita gelatinovora]|uniref:Uncharacterized protein n=1 Tax=Thalassovita gelatinovora TaxID=53501 RepID=A0A0P1F9C0_THAGE|nr:hypothetical protein TG4357_01441 [Thalassovita gelatinovora]SEP93474.1 hypothetical protein SAMN04488043_102234 [Thalassovita gelatinovora]